MPYEVVNTGNGYLIVLKVTDTTGVRSVECTKRQWDDEFLEKLADGLNRDPASASYQISLSVLNRYEFAIYASSATLMLRRVFRSWPLP